MTADRANPVLSLVASGVLSRVDVAASATYAGAGARATRIHDLTREHFGRPATLAEVVEARAVLGVAMNDADAKARRREARAAHRAASRSARPRGASGVVAFSTSSSRSA